MKLHELKPNTGSTTNRKRVGRGTGSGLGKTSGRGEKGQKARSGYSRKPAFEGGQLPLYRRIPKRGFSNYEFKVEYATVNVGDLNCFEDGTVITPELLLEYRIINKLLCGVKILGDGNLEKKLIIKAHKFTNSAKVKIETAGGKAEVI